MTRAAEVAVIVAALVAPAQTLRTDRTAQVIIAGYAFVQNLRRGHYELGLDTPPATRLAAALTELAWAIRELRARQLNPFAQRITQQRRGR